MLEWRAAELPRLELLHEYLRGKNRFRWLPSSPPIEVVRLAEMSRVNFAGLVVDTIAQSLYVDGYRSPEGTPADVDPIAWEVWQRNRLDAHQTGIHRAGLAYGAAYAVVLPGDPVPAIRGVSPRRMTVVYGEDADWPIWALESRPSAAGALYRLFDDEATYWVGMSDAARPELLDWQEHGLGVCPVVRFRPTDDLDDEVLGEVEPLIQVQDQINITTFGLLVSEHYAAFRQRYVVGWTAEAEEKLKASVARLWTFEDHPDEIKLGEFEQTDLAGYIESREASIRHLATISQTPTHELLGSLANLSAEALVAAEASHRRKLGERQTMFGESWEQVFELAGRAGGFPTDPLAQVRWRDTESRSLAQTVDALGKLAQMLGVPVEALWERIPGMTQQDVESWRAAKAAEPAPPAATPDPLEADPIL
jgi:hypothetical protein